ncbi:hypothetical protein DNJ72_05150 [Prochlorococcus marinus XMU1403]|uniref:hypothetical protein n=1 Tax=Prochlorococcus marinus TaxID=1219 RepID=UPI000D99D967|nr:hypothetical protein [Prochlorococcus marinus]MBW3049491.1 hypothetical protein [Prochlorococcus marinus str. MU1403]PYE01724.1 hypothetical protein DNJ72_05150 [Prochlorococcus marinus XMU1403]
MKNFLIKLVLFVFIVFSGLNSAEAVIQGWVPPEDYGEGDSYEMGMETDEEAVEMESQTKELSMEDIFGDEQVFPFPPGLGN